MMIIEDIRVKHHELADAVELLWIAISAEVSSKEIEVSALADNSLKKARQCPAFIKGFAFNSASTSVVKGEQIPI